MDSTETLNKIIERQCEEFLQQFCVVKNALFSLYDETVLNFYKDMCRFWVYLRFHRDNHPIHPVFACIGNIDANGKISILTVRDDQNHVVWGNDFVRPYHNIKSEFIIQ